MHFVFLSVVVLLRLMHLRRPHTDLFAVLRYFLLAVSLEQGFQVAELLLFGVLNQPKAFRLVTDVAKYRGYYPFAIAPDKTLYDLLVGHSVELLVGLDE